MAPADQVRRKIHPKIRMAERGSSEVNGVRAERWAGMCVTAARSEEPCMLAADMPVLAAREAEVGTLREVPRDVLVNVFVHTTDGRAVSAAEARTCSRDRQPRPAQDADVAAQ